VKPLRGPGLRARLPAKGPVRPLAGRLPAGLSAALRRPAGRRVPDPAGSSGYRRDACDPGFSSCSSRQRT